MICDRYGAITSIEAQEIIAITKQEKVTLLLRKNYMKKQSFNAWTSLLLRLSPSGRAPPTQCKQSKSCNVFAQPTKIDLSQL